MTMNTIKNEMVRRQWRWGVVPGYDQKRIRRTPSNQRMVCKWGMQEAGRCESDEAIKMTEILLHMK